MRNRDHMSNQNTAEIMSVGTELLRGEITDTNAGYLASELPLLGIEVRRMSTVAARSSARPMSFAYR